MRRREKKMKNLKKNKKGVSDVIAVLLMIAIAVAASLIAYAWVMGYLGGTTNKVGKAIQIQSMYYSTSGSGTLTIYVQNVGSGPVTLTNVYENGQNATSISFSPATLPMNQTSTVTTGLPAGFNPVNAVDVKVVCSDGTFIEATQTVPGS
jgi:archaeal type IV pilus assembly protein PilA